MNRDGITYEAVNKPIVLFHVRLGRKIVGSIKKNPNNGWFYYQPKGFAGKGQEMGTIAEVKASIEEP